MKIENTQSIASKTDNQWSLTPLICEEVTQAAVLSTKRNPVKPNIDPACFVAGTLVHTKEGLRPIEEIKVGDWVLSKPENGEGEQAYKRVTQTFVHEDREVRLLTYSKVQGVSWMPDCKSWTGHLIVTANHPFFVKGQGWVKAGQLIIDNVFVTTDEAEDTGVWKHEILRVTDTDNLAWVQAHNSDEARSVDFRVYPYHYGVMSDLDNHELIYDAWTLRQVFNIEVEDYHTYYVGAIGSNNAGVLVHNKNHADIAAVQRVAENGLFVSNGVPVYNDDFVTINSIPGPNRGVVLANARTAAEETAGAIFEQ